MERNDFDVGILNHCISEWNVSNYIFSESSVPRMALLIQFLILIWNKMHFAILNFPVWWQFWFSNSQPQHMFNNVPWWNAPGLFSTGKWNVTSQAKIEYDFERWLCILECSERGCRGFPYISFKQIQQFITGNTYKVPLLLEKNSASVMVMEAA